jgi:hypothetical protein
VAMDMANGEKFSKRKVAFKVRYLR